MKFFSTNHQSPAVSLREAVFRGLPPDNGLYMPERVPTLSAEFFNSIENLTLPEIAFEVTHALLGEDVPATDLRQIIQQALTFEAPVVEIEPGVYVLELFHGPSMAFKDFGARFMAGLMAYFLTQEQKEIHILVATSGDTGGAVAQGFFGTPGIRVTILYPTGKVSAIQEKQLTTLGGNVTALEVDGTFDDCQRLVKQAFLDADLSARFNLSSANSINIARLIPQTFYYFGAYAQLKKLDRPLVFSIPSGNFGNLSAGILARRMGLPIKQFIAATNLNHAVPDYLKTGKYSPQPSVETISNAMDVGSPSNFVRMKLLSGVAWRQVRSLVTGDFYDDTQTRQAMKLVYEATGYVMCPHTAVAYLALKNYLQTVDEPVTGVFLATAHPAKFLNVVEEAIGIPLPLPGRLAALLDKEKAAHPMTSRFEEFKAYLLAEV